MSSELEGQEELFELTEQDRKARAASMRRHPSRRTSQSEGEQGCLLCGNGDCEHAKARQ